MTHLLPSWSQWIDRIPSVLLPGYPNFSHLYPVYAWLFFHISIAICSMMDPKTGPHRPGLVAEYCNPLEWHFSHQTCPQHHFISIQMPQAQKALGACSQNDGFLPTLCAAYAITTSKSRKCTPLKSFAACTGETKRGLAWKHTKPTLNPTNTHTQISISAEGSKEFNSTCAPTVPQQISRALSQWPNATRSNQQYLKFSLFLLWSFLQESTEYHATLKGKDFYKFIQTDTQIHENNTVRTVSSLSTNRR